MKPFDKLKDILYDSIDYIIMIGIVAVVILVIGWRLDILFTDSDVSELPTNEVSELIDNEEEPKPDDKNNSPSNELPETPSNVDPEVREVQVNIPDGSLPSDIGKILQENGLVENSKDFVAKAVELGLDTKLRSGNYSLNSGQSIEEIVLIISKQASNN
ncbi:endolytic transglycosylase MltG [Soehngenia saccharolytica]|nr:endolytic transglycosylase MltG [Soehngenia saccharolytica]